MFLLWLTFMSADIIFHKFLELHSTLTEKKDFCHKFSFLTDWLKPLPLNGQNLLKSMTNILCRCDAPLKCLFLFVNPENFTFFRLFENLKKESFTFSTFYSPKLSQESQILQYFCNYHSWYLCYDGMWWHTSIQGKSNIIMRISMIV